MGEVKQRSFWDRVDEASEEVAKWPAWKRAAADRVYQRMADPDPLINAFALGLALQSLKTTTADIMQKLHRTGDHR